VNALAPGAGQHDRVHPAGDSGRLSGSRGDPGGGPGSAPGPTSRSCAA
jgi:hypothetical protein